MTRCDVMHYEGKPSTSPAIHCCGVPEPVRLLGSVEDQIFDFLDGKTDGETVLHSLYDHVLNEPIPERMRALFRAGSAD
jgi:hypothetical protein